MFSGIRSAISGARDAVGDLASGVAEAGRVGQALAGGVTKAATSVVDRFESETLSRVVGAAAEALTGQRSPGSLVSGALDRVGLPDWAAAFAGAAVDALTARPDAAVTSVLTTASGVAERVGAGGVAEFLGAAGGVSGMVSSSGPTGVAAARPGGLLAELDSRGATDSLQRLSTQAGRLAGGLDQAVDVVGAWQTRDLSAVSDGLFELVENQFSGLSEWLGDRVDAEVVEKLQAGLDEAARRCAQTLHNKGGEARVESGIAQEGARLARALEGMADVEGDFFEILSESGATAGLRRQLVERAENLSEGDLEVLQLMVSEAFDFTRGLIEIAELDEGVARELSALLNQSAQQEGAQRLGHMIAHSVRA